MNSPLTKKLIRDGLKPRSGKLTDAQALVERLEDGAGPGVTAAQRRRLLREAAAFIRERLNIEPNRSVEAA